MKWILICLTAVGLSACTYSINMVHTEGSASDVVDETDTPTVDLKASIPASVIQ